MPATDNPPVKAKAVLIDPATMTAVWMNESARATLAVLEGEAVPVAKLAPIPALSDIEDSVREVAQTGEVRHLRADLVSGARGRVTVATSLYPLPDGRILMVTENAFQVAPKAPARR